MLISLNEIKKLVKIPDNISTEELITRIGSRLVEVEGSVDWSERYRNIYIIKVVTCEEIPGTHLHLCKIDAGDAGVEFAKDYAKNHPGEELTNDENLVQVVCGAPNVHAGMLAVWIQPGAIVPCTFDDEKLELSVRPLRGYDSYGMLAGADELGLDTERKGIAEIDPKTQVADGTGTAGSGSFRAVRPGDAFADVFDLNDIILDIENKSLTHRPDTFGLIGFAREVAGILGVKFEEPTLSSILEDKLSDLKSSSKNLSIKISDSTLCPRYSAAIFEVDDALASEKYLNADAIFIAKAGMRPISKIVDATNIVMLLTGQPLHAFDYDKFVRVGGSKTPEILVRAAKPGETLQLLDGKEVELKDHDIIITSSNVPVALAGAMGGMNTEIDASTHRVILESATFSLYNLRKTQMAHGIFSEAITRFTKGQPTSGTIPALERCISMLVQNSDSIVEFQDCYPNPVSAVAIFLTNTDINSLLGSNYSDQEIQTTLENVGFEVKTKAASGITTFSVTAPAHRTDIHIKEDIIEEVGRLNGYDNIPATLPLRPFVGAGRNALFDLKCELRNILSDRLGAHEVLTYSFVSKSLQEKCGEDAADSYEIVNSISPELECFRQSILPSLLEKLAKNQKSGFQDFALYEFNQITKKSLGLNEEKVPELENHLAYICTGDYYLAKAAIEKLAEILHINIEVKPFDKSTGGLNAPYFEPLHSAEIWTKDKEGNSIKLAALGEFKHRVATRLKAKDTVSGFELDLSALSSAARNTRTHRVLSKFPSTTRDLTLKTPTRVTYAELKSSIIAALASTPDLIYDVVPVSIYAPSEEATPKFRNTSFRITFSSTKKTLESGEISAIMESIAQSTKSLDAETI